MISQGYDGEYKLVDAETGVTLMRGVTVTSGNNDLYRLDGGKAPHKPGSTGRVYVTLMDYGASPGSQREYYPSVVGAKWVKI